MTANLQPPVYRFNDLVDAVPKGPFYVSKGIVLPYKSLPTTLRLETGLATTKFWIFVNENMVREVMSDANGNIVFNYILPLGEVEITIIDQASGLKQTSYCTVRDWALWLAAYADAFDAIDSEIETTQNDLMIETATINGVDDHFGDAVGTYNNLGQGLDTFRKMVHGIRLGYRNFGSRYGGLEAVVAAFTQVPPLGYPRRFWGPNWRLDQSMLKNHRFLRRSHDIYDAAAPTNVTGVTLVGVEPDVLSAPVNHRLGYTVATNMLTWEPAAVPGTPVEANDGSLFLPGPNSAVPAFILGQGPGMVLSGVVSRLYLNVDDLGTVMVDFSLWPGYPLPTVAQVAAAINGTLLADVRYGGAYAAFASVYNTKLLLQSPVAAGSQIIVEHGSGNAASVVIGVKPGDIQCNKNPFTGVEIVDVGATGAFASLFGNFYIEYRYDEGVTPPTRELRYKTPWAPVGAWTPVTQNGYYTLYDAALNGFCRVYCFFDDMPELAAPWPAISLVTITSSAYLGYNRSVSNLAQTQGLWVSVDKDNLPVGNTADIIKVYDDVDDLFVETPDDWSINIPAGFTSYLEYSDVIQGKETPLSPNSAFKWRLINAGIQTMQLTSRVELTPMPRPGPRGTNYPQRNTGLFYDYEGFTARFSVWARNYNAAAATITLEFSFDNGGTWVSSAAQAIVTDTGGLGYEDPTQVSFETIIPAAVTDNGVLVRITPNCPAGSIDISIDSPSVEVKYISSRYLERDTVARSRHRQYFGELVYVWSPEELTTKEREYIGLPHKSPSVTSPFSGMVISGVSSDTTAGVGVLEYEYNSLPDTRRVRWYSYGDTVGAWVPLVADGTYLVYSADGSYLTIDVTYTLLSVLSGTPPATSSTRSITISDTTIIQGHSRRISPAHASIDILDATEYDPTTGSPLNLWGAIYEGDFAFGTAVNLDIGSADPFRYGYLYPSDENVEGEELTVAAIAPHLATLTYQSDQDQTEAVLYEDGVPVSNDSWQFISSTQVQVLTTGLSPYNSSAVYTLDYNLLYQYTTHYIDLGGAFQDYAWFADYFLWERMENEEVEYLNTVPVYFNFENGRAYLDASSDMDMSVAYLTRYDGTDVKQIAKRYWRFVNRTTIEIDTSQLIATAQYFLTHNEVRVYEVSGITTVFEHRSGVDGASCSVAAWETIERNENRYVHQAAAGHQVHQLRLSVSGIRDVRDIRIHSMVMKGLNIHGVNPDLNGMTTLW